ncbi:MAG TPA: Maebl, partial [Sulfitobacter sp.]|nr:Maebl [Sulfitobacter sp.]
LSALAADLKALETRKTGNRLMVRLKS